MTWVTNQLLATALVVQSDLHILLYAGPHAVGCLSVCLSVHSCCTCFVWLFTACHSPWNDDQTIICLILPAAVLQPLSRRAGLIERHAQPGFRLHVGAIGKLSEQELAAVRSEVNMLTRLTHVNIARCRGSWQDEKHMYSVQEYGIRGDLFIEMFSER